MEVILNSVVGKGNLDFIFTNIKKFEFYVALQACSYYVQKTIEYYAIWQQNLRSLTFIAGCTASQ